MSEITPYIIRPVGGVGGSGTDAEWRFAQRVNSDTSTNLNNLTQTEVPMDGTLTTLGTGWSVDGNGIQLTGPDAWVKCTCSLHVGAAFNRANMTVRFALDGVLTGPIAAHGYIRNATGHNESSYTIPGFWIQMTQGQTITIETLREAGAGTISMQTAGTSYLLLERLVNV